MNERIKKLKEQATSYTWNGNDVTEELDEQKFAELIVQECAGIACEHMELNEGTDYNIGSKIKQHFGVK
jgi:hypothetical protein